MPDTNTPLNQQQVQAATQPLIDDAIQTEKEIAAIRNSHCERGPSVVT